MAHATTSVIVVAFFVVFLSIFGSNALLVKDLKKKDQDRYNQLNQNARDKALRKLANIQPVDAPFVSIDPDGEIYYEDEFPVLPSTTLDVQLSDSAVQRLEPGTKRQTNTIPILHSNLGSKNILYLDFDGEVVVNSAWNPAYGIVTINCLPFSLDGDVNTITAAESAAMVDIFERVSEDYSPFDIDITTERPANITTTVIQVVITFGSNENPNGTSVGGKAYIGVFGDSNYAYYRPAFVYANRLANVSKWIGDAASHEAGHNLGLHHDGTATASYFSGLGTGPTSWGPIMGSPYSYTLSQWSKGEYPSANNQEDDIAIIAKAVGWKKLTRPPKMVSGTSTPGCNFTFTGKSVIVNSTDVQSFNLTLSIPSGYKAMVNVSAYPWYSLTKPKDVTFNGNNLDVKLIFSGQIDSPLGTSNASIVALGLDSGSYPILVQSGSEYWANSNFSTYGSIGQVNVDVCVTLLPSCTSGLCCDTGYGILRAGGYACRTSVDNCDITEYCDGISPDCPTDTFKNSSVVCRISMGPCDVAEYCTGYSGCPVDTLKSNGTVCRNSSGVCDLPETCDGVSFLCPANAYVTAGTVCGVNTFGLCALPPKCNGTWSGCPTAVNIPQPNGTICRQSNGTCDAPEFCDGTNTGCPSDKLLGSAVICRESAGPCDIAESCTGLSITCPTDVLSRGSVCRDSIGACDIPEMCNGDSPLCPTDTFSFNTTLCRNATDICDEEEYCTGHSPICPEDLVSSPYKICRESFGACDKDEKCDGNSTGCPVDSFSPSTVICRAKAGPCDIEEYCQGNSIGCPDDELASNTSFCDVLGVYKCNGSSPLCPEKIFSISVSVGKRLDWSLLLIFGSTLVLMFIKL